MKLVTFSEIKGRYGIGYVRDHLRRKCRAGEFPAPVQVSSRRIAWREDDIDAWVAALAKQEIQR